jgi:hypothetical protein
MYSRVKVVVPDFVAVEYRTIIQRFENFAAGNFVNSDSC